MFIATDIIWRCVPFWYWKNPSWCVFLGFLTIHICVGSVESDDLGGSSNIPCTFHNRVLSDVLPVLVGFLLYCPLHVLEKDKISTDHACGTREMSDPDMVTDSDSSFSKNDRFDSNTLSQCVNQYCWRYGSSNSWKRICQSQEMECKYEIKTSATRILLRISIYFHVFPSLYLLITCFQKVIVQLIALCRNKTDVSLFGQQQILYIYI